MLTRYRGLVAHTAPSLMSYTLLPNIESLEWCSSDPLPTSRLLWQIPTYYCGYVEKLKSYGDRDLGLVLTRLTSSTTTENRRNFQTFNSQLSTTLALSEVTTIQALKKHLLTSTASSMLAWDRSSPKQVPRTHRLGRIRRTSAKAHSITSLRA